MEPAAWRRDAVSPLPPVFFVPFREEQKKRRRRQGGRRKKQKEESSRGAAKRIQSARGGEAGIKTLLVFLVENLRGFYDYDVGLAVFAR